MRIPRCVVFWECVASDFLDLRDLARFEAAADSRDVRMTLLLDSIAPRASLRPSEDPITPLSMLFGSQVRNNKSSESLCSPRNDGAGGDRLGPYHSLLNINERAVVLESPEMERWCERRGVRIANVVVQSSSDYRDPKSFDTLIFSRRVTLRLRKQQSSANVFSRMGSIEALTIAKQVTDIDIAILLTTCAKNSARLGNEPARVTLRPHSRSSYLLASVVTPLGAPRGPRYLIELHVTEENLPPDGLDRLIRGLRFIQIFSISGSAESPFDKQFQDKHLEMIVQYWPNLSSLSLQFCHFISDNGFSALAKAFNPLNCLTVKYSRVTPRGLEDLLLQNASRSSALKDLRLLHIGVSQDFLINRLLPHCSQLKRLDFMCESVSDPLLDAISVFCPSLEDIHLPNGGYDNAVTDHGVTSLLRGCKNLTALHLGCCPLLTELSASTITSLGPKIKDLSCTRNRAFLSSMAAQFQKQESRTRLNGEFVNTLRQNNVSVAPDDSWRIKGVIERGREYLLTVIIAVLLVTVQIIALGVVAAGGSYLCDLLSVLILGRSDLSPLCKH